MSESFWRHRLKGEVFNQKSYPPITKLKHFEEIHKKYPDLSSSDEYQAAVLKLIADTPETDIVRLSRLQALLLS